MARHLPENRRGQFNEWPAQRAEIAHSDGSQLASKGCRIPAGRTVEVGLTVAVIPTPCATVQRFTWLVKVATFNAKSLNAVPKV
jgi:hypothetical protein